MRRIADRFRDFTEMLAPVLQPITETELYLILHAERPASRMDTHEQELASGLSVHERELVKVVLTQWSINTAYEDLLRRVVDNSNSCQQLLCQLSDNENLVQTARKVLIRRYAEPCFRRLNEFVDVSIVESTLEQTGSARRQLKSLKEKMLVSNQRVRLILTKKRNMQQYLKHLKQVKGVLGEVSLSGYAQEQLEIIRKRIDDPRLQQYAFSRGLQTFLRSQIENYSVKLSERIARMLIEYIEEDIFQLAEAVLRLDEKDESELPSIVARGCKKAIKRQLAEIVRSLRGAQQEQEITASLRQLSTTEGVRFIAKVLLLFERIYKNCQRVVEKICGAEWEEECNASAKDIIRTYLHVFVMQLKPQLFVPKVVVLPVMDVLMNFTRHILKCQRLWTDLSALWRSWLEYEQGEIVSQVDTDISSEEWQLIDNLEPICLSEQLRNFVQEKSKWDYETQLTSMAEDSTAEELNSVPRQRVSMLFSLFNCLRYLQSRMFNLVLLANCGEEYTRLLASDYNLVIKFYAMNLVGMMVCHPDLKQQDGLKVCIKIHFPSVSDFIDKNRHYIYEREEAPRTVQPSEALAEACRNSLTVFCELIEPHQSLAKLISESLRLNLYGGLLAPLPDFVELLAVTLLVARVDLSDFRTDAWLQLSKKDSFEIFLDSFKLQYCRLREPTNRKLFVEKVESAVVHEISGKEHLRRKEFEQGLISYSQVEAHLIEAEIECGSDVRNYLIARASKDADPRRMDLARSKLKVFTARSLYSLVRDRQQQECLRKEYTSLIGE